MLRALKQLLRRGGRLAFTTITVTPGLEPPARRRASRAGPRAVASRAGQRRLLESAGFRDIDDVDITSEFVETATAWLDERLAHADALMALEAPGTFEQRVKDQRALLAALGDGLLRRGLYAATRP